MLSEGGENESKEQNEQKEQNKIDKLSEFFYSQSKFIQPSF